MKTKRCPTCKGKGEYPGPGVYPSKHADHPLITCRTCGGTGCLKATKKGKRR